jgi:hypothetical protein
MLAGVGGTLVKLGAVVASAALMAGATILFAPWIGSPETGREMEWVSAVEDYQLRLRAEVARASEHAEVLRSCPPERGPVECDAMLRALEARARGTRAEAAPSLGWSGVSGRLRARRAAAFVAMAALLAAVAEFPAGRRQLARVWPAPIAGVLAAAAVLAACSVAAWLAAAVGMGEGAVVFVLLALWVAPWAAALGAARSCGRRVLHAPLRTFSAAAIGGAAGIGPLVTWMGSPLHPVELFVLTVILAALLATGAGAMTAAGFSPRAPRTQVRPEA